jgi:hypothetical protein
MAEPNEVERIFIRIETTTRAGDPPIVAQIGFEVTPNEDGDGAVAGEFAGALRRAFGAFSVLWPYEVDTCDVFFRVAYFHSIHLDRANPVERALADALGSYVERRESAETEDDDGDEGEAVPKGGTT